MKKTIFKWIEHRHVILTVPESLREYFRDPEMLKALADCGVKTVLEAANISKKIQIGIIGVIQTQGRASCL